VSDWWRYIVALLLWPGLVGGALLGWLLLWLRRKLTARMQRRIGPPFYQPFFDFVKLLGKQTVVPRGVDGRLFYALPLVSLAAATYALALLPAPGNPAPSFGGDLILLIYLLETPALCDVLAGYSSRSVYGQVSAAREALLALGYNLPFLGAVIAIATAVGSYRLADLAAAPFGWAHLAAGLAFLLALPAKLKSNPFSIPNAEQEILGGAHTEYNGAPLALFELAHAIELVALVGLFAILFLPSVANTPVALALYLLFGIGVVAGVTLLAAGTARLTISQAVRFYWRWGLAAAALAFVVALLFR
jgi:NADH-quinone oxidoreductase subunit H